MRTKKSYPVQEKVEIIDIAAEGKSVGKVDELVIFVEKALPGDVVDVQLYKKKKNYAEGKAIYYHTLSPLRAETFCEHFGICGGCKWQNLSYEAQLGFKHKHVSDALQRLAKVELPEIETISGSEDTRYYRNKLEYTFSNKRWLLDGENQSSETLAMDALGFHVPRRFDKIIDIQHCYLQPDLSNQIRNWVRTYALSEKLSFYDIKQHEGLLRNLIMRNSVTGEWMVVVVFARPDQKEITALMQALQKQFPQITSLQYIINQKKNDTIFDQELHLFAGRDHIFEQMTDPKGNVLKFRISPKSFYQTNAKQAEILYQIAASMAGLTGNELVYDLYTGTGTIANFVASSAKRVVGIEYIEDAVADARINSELNGIHNTSFFAGDMKDIFTEEFINTNGRPDVVITDPPRAGMHEDVVKTLLKLDAETIVYVSCNPSTQARDLALLDERYRVERVKPVDMFPHTEHVENVVLLKRRN